MVEDDPLRLNPCGQFRSLALFAQEPVDTSVRYKVRNGTIFAWPGKKSTGVTVTSDSQMDCPNTFPIRRP
jgi:hypothetical protein